jgi:hypothetical protein
MAERARLDVRLAAQAAVNMVVVHDVAIAVQSRSADVASEVLRVKQTAKRMDGTIGNDLTALSAFPIAQPFRAVGAEHIAADHPEVVLVKPRPAAVAAEAVGMDVGREAERANAVLKREDRERANRAYRRVPAHLGTGKAQKEALADNA